MEPFARLKWNDARAEPKPVDEPARNPLVLGEAVELVDDDAVQEAVVSCVRDHLGVGDTRHECVEEFGARALDGRVAHTLEAHADDDLRAALPMAEKLRD